MQVLHDTPPAALEDKTFGVPYVVHPTAKHAFTAVWLHGRGSSGEEFAGDLLGSTLSSGETLREGLQDYRWVFPSSRHVWSSAFEETLPAWFEAHSLTDITARQELQVDGLRESVSYVLRVMEYEVKILNGVSENLVLCGISQGAAVALWALLSVQMQSGGGIGGFIGLSTWLPFAPNLERLLASSSVGGDASNEPPNPEAKAMDDFVTSIIHLPDASEESQIYSTPLLLGHGSDDAYVDVELGRQATRILAQFGFSADWKEYIGAEEEGHWLKEPEEVDDVSRLLRSSVSRSRQ